MRRAFLIAAVVATPLAVAATPFAAFPLAAQSGLASAGQALISIVGQGEVERKPDFARIFVSVSTQADAVAAAVASNNEATERALARLAERGVAREDVQTANFQVYETPEERNPDGSIRPRPAFTATHQLHVVSRDVEGVGGLAGEILALEGMTFQSVAWGLDRSEDAQDEARRRAVADARRQAEVLGDAAGVRLGPIARMADAAVSPGFHEADAAPMLRMSAAASAVPIVPPATIRYTASVRIDWEIAR